MSEPDKPQQDSTPTPEKKRSGPKTVTEKFLDKNPELKKMFVEGRAKDGKPELPNGSDIAGLNDILEYLYYELTRTKDENLLRGKTLTEYGKLFETLCRLKVDIDKETAEIDAKCKKIINDRAEVETFMKIIYESLNDVIKDIPTKKELIEKIQKLYDKHYPTSNDNKSDSNGNTNV